MLKRLRQLAKSERPKHPDIGKDALNQPKPTIFSSKNCGYDNFLTKTKNAKTKRTWENLKIKFLIGWNFLFYEFLSDVK